MTTNNQENCTKQQMTKCVSIHRQYHIESIAEHSDSIIENGTATANLIPLVDENHAKKYRKAVR